MEGLFSLPNELKEEILLLLPFRDIFYCYLCGERETFFSPSLWRRKAQRDLGVPSNHFNLTRKAPYVRYYELYRMFYPKERKVPKIFLQGLPLRDKGKLFGYYFLSCRRKESSTLFASIDKKVFFFFVYLFGDILRYRSLLSTLEGKIEEEERFIAQSKELLFSLPLLYSYYVRSPLEEAKKANYLSQLFILEGRLDLYYSFFPLLLEEECIIFLANLIAIGERAEVERYLSFLESRSIDLKDLYRRRVFYRGSFKKGSKALSLAAAFSNSPELINRFVTSFEEPEKGELITGFLYSPNLNFFYLAREYGVNKEELAVTFHPDLDYF